MLTVYHGQPQMKPWPVIIIVFLISVLSYGIYCFQIYHLH